MEVFSSLNRSLIPLAGLRNLMAHEYLDLRFDRVKEFALVDADASAQMANIVRDECDSRDQKEIEWWVCRPFIGQLKGLGLLLGQPFRVEY